MSLVIIREPTWQDEAAFLAAIERSQELHSPWIRPPLTAQEFQAYVQHFKRDNQKSYLVCDLAGNITGVFNISEIVRGQFQNAYLGFYAMADFAGKGCMSHGLKLVLHEVFKTLDLHRIEANIQPENRRSIHLVQKNGFRYEGYSPRYLSVNGVWRGHEHWAMTHEDFIRDDEEIVRQDRVEIVPYHSEWPILAELEMKMLRSVFPKTKIVDIQHVGSTAIPGTPAKPIIDIQIAVKSLDEIKLLAITELQKLGYEFWPENPDPTRLFFAKGMPPYGEKRTHHVHIVEYDSDHWRNKICFRDYLLAHPEVAKEYAQLKHNLARENAHDREKYTDAKSEFVQKIVKLSQEVNDGTDSSDRKR